MSPISPELPVNNVNNAPLPRSLNFNIVSKKLGSEKLSQYLNEALREMAHLLPATKLKAKL